MSSNTEFDNISFDLPKNQSNVIKVIGVGGGGSNAINHMFSQGIKGVDFVICNTDAQALENSSVPIKIQLGVSLTEGLGAGANPKIGEQSAMESLEDIKNMLVTNTKMIFITAGMGGGTGTGAAPIIAKMAKEMDILTVGIVTIPFEFEGKIRNQQAQIGVENLRENCDSLIVINNNKLREVYGNLGFKAGFSKADEVLATAARGIAEVITHHYTQNIDLRDAKTVLANSGTAIMGSAVASGANRAHEGISKALDSPLLNDNKITGAKNVLLLIVSGTEEITIDEIGEISDHIQTQAGHSANIIMGVGEDEELEGAISITVIATGFDAEQQDDIVNTETKKIIHTLEDEQVATQDLTTDRLSGISSEAEAVIKEVAPKQEAVIRHTLFEDESELDQIDNMAGEPFEGFIPTTELIRNIEVDCTELDIHYLAEFQEIEVGEIDVNQFVILEENSEEMIEVEREEAEAMDEQMLMFDLPVNASSKQMAEGGDQTEEETVVVKSISDIEVHDAVEVRADETTRTEEVTRYSLEDYEMVESHLNEAKHDLGGDDQDAELAFETRTVEREEETNPEGETADPLNTPISKLLRDRTEERRRKMKEFNYKFRNSASKIDEIEKQPAYKRMGIELDEVDKDNGSLSRTSLSIDDDDDIDLRSNNSFLHDNVD